jgi:hypothetical protein
MRKRDIQKGTDIVQWLLGLISTEELRMEKAKNGKFFTDYSDENYPVTIFQEI